MAGVVDVENAQAVREVGSGRDAVPAGYLRAVGVAVEVGENPVIRQHRVEVADIVRVPFEVGHRGAILGKAGVAGDVDVLDKDGGAPGGGIGGEVVGDEAEAVAGGIAALAPAGTLSRATV